MRIRVCMCVWMSHAVPIDIPPTPFASPPLSLPPSPPLWCALSRVWGGSCGGACVTLVRWVFAKWVIECWHHCTSAIGTARAQTVGHYATGAVGRVFWRLEKPCSSSRHPATATRELQVWWRKRACLAASTPASYSRTLRCRLQQARAQRRF